MAEGSDTLAPSQPVFIRRCIQIRDAGLVIGGIAYAFGYLSRAVSAWENNLGPLPGARFDYLVAGALLLILPALLGLTLWLVWRSAKVLARMAANDPERRKTIGAAFGWAITGSILVFVLTIPWHSIIARIALILFSASMAYWLMYLFARERLATKSADAVENDVPTTGRHSVEPKPTVSAEETPSWGVRIRSWGVRFRRAGPIFGQALGNAFQASVGFAMIASIGLQILVLFLMSALLGSKALENLPPELGGVHPKWAILDLDTSNLSLRMQSKLVDATRDTSTASGVRASIPLEVYSTSGPWLVRIPSSDVPAARPSLRLEADAVRSVEWLSPKDVAAIERATSTRVSSAR